jgi:hypothetical protein
LPTLAVTNNLRIAGSETVSFQVIRQSEQANIFRVENVADSWRQRAHSKAREFAGNRQTVGITEILPDARRKSYGCFKSLPTLSGILLMGSKIRRPAPANYWRSRHFAGQEKQRYGGFKSLPILGGKLLKRSKVRRPRQTLGTEKLSWSATCETSVKKH